LIPRKIIKTVATGRQILRLKCTKIDIGWDSTRDSTVSERRVLSDTRQQSSAK